MKTKLLLLLCLTSSSIFCTPTEICVFSICGALAAYMGATFAPEIQECCECPLPQEKDQSLALAELKQASFDGTQGKHSKATECITTQPGTTNE